MYRFLFIVVAAFFIADAKKLPPYLKPCKRNDPNINKCVKEHAIEAIPSLLKGDKSFKNPSLSPLHLPLVEIKASDRLTITLKDITLYGLETVVLEDVNFDLKNQHIEVDVFFPRLNLQSDYNIEGQVLILPISGNGPANITFDDVKVKYAFDYKLIKKGDGKDYMDPDIKPVVTFTLGKPYYYFGNLFNGDKNLGDRMNEFLNEHGLEVNKDLGQSVSETINAVVTNIIRVYLTVVPYENIFE